MIGKTTTALRRDLSYPHETPLPQPREHKAAYSDLAGLAIVRALLSDRPRGAALLFDRYAHEVNRMVWRLLEADPDHDDIVQHIFCTIIGRITTLRDSKKLDQWVHQVTVNTVFAELRKRRVRRMFLASQRSERRFGDLRRDVEARDLLEYASTLLDRMSPRERMVFVLYHVEGHTLNEISALCRFSLSTVKRRLASADRRFNKMFSREPVLASVAERQRPKA